MHWSYILGDYFSKFGEPEMKMEDGSNWFTEDFVRHLGAKYDEKYDELENAKWQAKVWKNRFILASCVAVIMIIVCLIK